jgi:hypothetical protein
MAIMDPSWGALAIGFAGGSVAAAAIGALAKYWLRPIITVRLDLKKGSYVSSIVFATDPNGQSFTFPARFLRLHVENTGRSSIKDCSGYITKGTKSGPGQKSEDQKEVLLMGWSHIKEKARDIPRGAFFHLDVVSLYLLPDGRIILYLPDLPNSLGNFFADKATYTFEILVAADNADPSKILVGFDYDPQNDELLNPTISPAE